MNRALLVPIHLDALVLENEETVLEAMADFSRLPYYDGKRKQNVNADAPYISEEIVSHPFRDQSLRLGRGVHLHWALPDALTQGVNTAKGVVFPTVPDRWLVTRTDDAGTVQKQWVVESDYLHPEVDPLAKPPPERPRAISFPLPPRPVDGMWQPYRFLGRKWQVSDGRPKDDPIPEYLNSLAVEGADKMDWHQVVGVGLTAIGYGEPSFAAFYPNCRSVFGLHDPNITSFAEFKKVRYDVIGWYDQPEKRDSLRKTPTKQTPFEQTLAAVRRRISNEHEASGLPDQKPKEQEVWHEALAHHYGWVVPKDSSANQTETKEALPQRTICYAKLSPTTDGTGSFGPDPAATLGAVEVAVGNTASEALSAYLAEKIDGDKVIIEEQLEALDLGQQIEHHQLDIGPKFLEARHDKGFSSMRSGVLWTVSLERNTIADSTSSESTAADSTAQETLPAFLAHPLNRLNVAQRNFERAQHEMDSLRREIYHDWTLYMQALRPPSGLSEDLPDPVEIARFIEQNGLTQLKRRLASTGSLTVEQVSNGDEGGRNAAVTGASVPSHTDDTAFASRLTDRINEMASGIRIANKFRRLDLAIAASQKEGSEDPKSLRVELKSFLEKRGIECDKIDSVEALRDLIHQQLADLSDPDQYKKFEGSLTPHLRLLPKAIMIYALRQVNAPRYYRPADPVVLMAGDAVHPTERHGTDGNELGCKIISDANFPRVSQWEDEVPAQLETILRTIRAEKSDGDQIGARDWRRQPWHPFLMEWQAEMFPVSDGGNRDLHRRSYASGFVDRNYRLEETAVNLTFKPGVAQRLRTADTGLYTGSCVLTDFSPQLLKAKLDRFLIRTSLEQIDGAIATLKPDDEARTEQLKAALTSFLDDLKEAHEDLNDLESLGRRIHRVATGLSDDARLAQIKKHLHDLCLAIDETDDKTVAKMRDVREYLSHRPNTLSQALDGFHEALLQRHQILQLPIVDPVGFADMKPLTDAVREATQGRHANLPLRGTDFTPIRSGTMKLRRLRLVDTFGRVRRVLDPDRETPLIISEPLRSPEMPGAINLPPRLVQPARLNFRWLSSEPSPDAKMDEPETNSNPAYSPVCGWLLPNNLDKSLMVYDKHGVALGTIIEVNDHVAWQPAPGSDLPRWEIEKAESARMNPPLRKLVNTIVNDLGKREEGFFEQYLASLTNALETIAPEDFSHHQSLALLIGRPIAVVRAMVNLELRGRPAVNQSLSVFWEDMMRSVDPEEGPGESHERRSQFNLDTTEKAAFLQALTKHDPAGIRPAFTNRNLTLPPADSDIKISAEGLEGRDGRWRIHLPARSYIVRRDHESVHVYLDTERTTDDFTHVRFPVRIGEDQQLNDGLVGYFLEEVDGQNYHYKNNCFYAPQAASREPLDLSIKPENAQDLANRLDLPGVPGEVPGEIAQILENPSSAVVTVDKTGHRWRIDTDGHVYNLVRSANGIDAFELLDASSHHIRVHWKEPINLMQSIDDAPQKLTMLVDPQGSVHAVSGILPTKSIKIPTDQYAEALRKLEVTFLSTPILTDQETTNVPLAAEPGYQWSWLTRRGAAWIESAEIEKIDTHATFSGQQRIVEGWLKLRRENDS